VDVFGTIVRCLGSMFAASAASWPLWCLVCSQAQACCAQGGFEMVCLSREWLTLRSTPRLYAGMCDVHMAFDSLLTDLWVLTELPVCCSTCLAATGVVWCGVACLCAWVRAAIAPQDLRSAVCMFVPGWYVQVVCCTHNWGGIRRAVRVVTHHDLHMR
jgi:hypothetical protein